MPLLAHGVGSAEGPASEGLQGRKPRRPHGARRPSRPRCCPVGSVPVLPAVAFDAGTLAEWRQQPGAPAYCLTSRAMRRGRRLQRPKGNARRSGATWALRSCKNVSGTERRTRTRTGAPGSSGRSTCNGPAPVAVRRSGTAHADRPSAGLAAGADARRARMSLDVRSTPSRWRSRSASTSRRLR